MNIGSYPDTFITAHEVGQFVTHYSLSRKGFKKNGDIFRDLLGSLDAVSMILESDAEKALHNVFGLKGTVDECLKQLQGKIDAINNSRLRKFAVDQLNECIRSHNELSTSHLYTEDIIAGLKKYVVNDKEIMDIPITDLTETQLYNLFRNAIIEGRKIKKEAGKSTSGAPSERVLKKNVHDIIKSINNKKVEKISKTYKSDILVFLQKQAENAGESILKSTWTVSIPDIEENNLDLLAYYPYFSLTPEQEKIACNTGAYPGKDVWEAFKTRIINYACEEANSLLTNQQAHLVFDQLGPEHFITNNINTLKGIFGEIQAGFIFTILLGDNYSLAMTGKEKNLENQQLNVDLVINKDIGIQVKNYAGYKDQDLNQLGYHLRDNLNWLTFVGKSVTGDIMDLSQYISTVSYNQPTAEAKANNEPYVKLYNQLTAKNNAFNNILNATLAANLEAFYPITDSLMNTNPLIKEGFKNVFFIFGGDKIIPTYKIFKMLYDRVEKIQYALEHDSTKSEFVDFRTTHTYNGEVWENTDTYQSIENILQHVKIYIDLNIYLENLLPK